MRYFRYQSFLTGIFFAVLGCGTAMAQSATEVRVQGKPLEVNLYPTRGPMATPAQRVADQLGIQKPAELDAGLQVLAVRWLRYDDMDDLNGLMMEFAVDAEGLPSGVRILRIPNKSRRRGLSEMSVGLRLSLTKLVQEWRFNKPLQQGKPVGFCCVRLISQPE